MADKRRLIERTHQHNGYSMLQIANGTSLTTVAGNLGYCNSSTTTPVYAHAIQSAAAASAETLNTLLLPIHKALYPPQLSSSEQRTFGRPFTYSPQSRESYRADSILRFLGNVHYGQNHSIRAEKTR